MSNLTPDPAYNLFYIIYIFVKKWFVGNMFKRDKAHLSA